MKKWPVFFSLLLSFSAMGQRTIKGRVLNAVTGTAVSGSSVFITNTSKGTISDASGNFELSAVPPGKHELIISSIGYETVVYPFNETQLPLQLKVELQIKVKELQNVTIEPFLEEGWDKWGKTFTENFLGYTGNAARCRIKNENAIRFRYFRKSNRLIAFADEPLKIENKALGYTISYQLEEFELNFKEQTALFLGYSLYEETGRDRKALQKRRNAAYYGSMMHFIRSLYSDSLKENDYEVRRMYKRPNTEKERVKSVYKPLHLGQAGGGMTVITENVPQGMHPDTLSYYRSVLRQPDLIEVYGSELLGADSLIMQEDGNHKLFYFANYLYVTYMGETEDEAYVKSQMQNRKPSFQRSFLFLPQLNPVWIEANGNYYNPRDMYFLGYWSWSDKMGDSLPLDFEPGK